MLKPLPTSNAGLAPSQRATSSSASCQLSNFSEVLFMYVNDRHPLFCRYWRLAAGFVASLILILLGYTTATSQDFITDDETTSVPFDLVDNRPVVVANIDGRNFFFLVDTGGANAISVPAARKLKLPIQIVGTNITTGEDRQTVGFTHIPHFRLGKLELSGARFAVGDLTKLRDGIGFPALDGILGIQLFSRHVVTFDYEHQVLTISRQPLFADVAYTVPFELIAYRYPVIKATIEGIRANLIVDTGDRLMVTLSEPFAAGHTLKAHGPVLRDVLVGWGTGDAVNYDVTRLHEVAFANTVLSGPITKVYTKNGGYYGTQAIFDGSLGGALLKHFIVELDYDALRASFVPYDKLDPEGFDETGMWLVRSNGAFDVRYILKGGPADEAGLRVSDEIISVNGTPVKALNLPALRLSFYGFDSRNVAFGIVRAHANRSIIVHLRPLI